MEWHNYRIVVFKEDLWRLSDPNPCSKTDQSQGYTQCQGLLQVITSQVWDVCEVGDIPTTLGLGSSVWPLSRGNIFPNTRQEFSVSQHLHSPWASNTVCYLFITCYLFISWSMMPGMNTGTLAGLCIAVWEAQSASLDHEKSRPQRHQRCSLEEARRTQRCRTTAWAATGLSHWWKGFSGERVLLGLLDSHRTGTIHSFNDSEIADTNKSRAGQQPAPPGTCYPGGYGCSLRSQLLQGHRLPGPLWSSGPASKPGETSCQWRKSPSFNTKSKNNP